MSRRLTARLGALALVAALAGCGAAPPQAPLARAGKLDSSLSGLSSSCGLAYQVTAFAKPGMATLRRYEAMATTAARKLASVYKADPTWVYQGATVRKIVHDSIEMLGSCALTQAATTLREDTRQ